MLRIQIGFDVDFFCAFHIKIYVRFHVVHGTRKSFAPTFFNQRNKRQKKWCDQIETEAATKMDSAESGRVIEEENAANENHSLVESDYSK